jgi:hypothetical protein
MKVKGSEVETKIGSPPLRGGEVRKNRRSRFFRTGMVRNGR